MRHARGKLVARTYNVADLVVPVPDSGLYAELISGTAFTAPRADNRRTWCS